MATEFWHRQASDKPLFPDLLWSRPENKQFAGKLLIVGGNLYGFSAPAEAYQTAVKAGIGTARVLLPDALQKTVGRMFEAGEYAPSTPSGSFGQKALAELLAMSNWSDGVVIAGDLGRNSETAILLEKFVEKYPGQLTVTKDAADYFTAAPQKLLSRGDTTLVISLAQIQKLASSVKYPKAVTFSMDLIRIVELLHDFTEKYPVNLIIKHLENIITASQGKVSSTKLAAEMEIWRVNAAACAATWWLQNPSKPFKSLTTAVFESIKTA